MSECRVTCRWCKGPIVDPKPGKDNCSERCKNTLNSALRLWGRKALEDGLVDEEVLRKLWNRSRSPCTASAGHVEG